MEDPRLLVFPALSFLSIVAAMSLIFGGSAIALGPDTFGSAHSNPTVMFYVIVAFCAYVATALSIYFNVALVTCAARRLRGEQTGIRDGLGAALYCLPQILTWAAIAVAVGYLIRAIEDRLPLGVGRFVVRIFLQASWGVATFFIIPEIAFGSGSAVDALKGSVKIVRDRWGETGFGSVGIGSITALGTFVPAGVFFFLGASGGGAPVYTLGVFWVLGALLKFSTIRQVYLAALYDYATTGREPVGFLPDDMAGAFR
jgi:hypothetical protein